MISKITQQIVSTALVGAVVLGGLHGRDLAKLSADHADARLQAADTQSATGGALSKIASDLHNHIDKQSLHSLLLKAGAVDGNNNHIDSRSLRLLRSHRLISAAEIKHTLFGDDILGLLLITAKVNHNT